MGSFQHPWVTGGAGALLRSQNPRTACDDDPGRGFRTGLASASWAVFLTHYPPPCPPPTCPFHPCLPRSGTSNIAPLAPPPHPGHRSPEGVSKRQGQSATSLGAFHVHPAEPYAGHSRRTSSLRRLATGSAVLGVVGAGHWEGSPWPPANPPHSARAPPAPKPTPRARHRPTAPVLLCASASSTLGRGGASGVGSALGSGLDGELLARPGRSGRMRARAEAQVSARRPSMLGADSGPNITPSGTARDPLSEGPGRTANARRQARTGSAAPRGAPTGGVGSGSARLLRLPEAEPRPGPRSQVRSGRGPGHRFSGEKLCAQACRRHPLPRSQPAEQLAGGAAFPPSSFSVTAR